MVYFVEELATFGYAAGVSFYGNLSLF